MTLYYFILNKSTDKHQTFYYKDAPSKIRKFYEDNCKLKGTTPKDYDTIIINTKDFNELMK